MPDPISKFDLQRVRAEFTSGRKIEAIKIYRMAAGADLAEAKRFVESLSIDPHGGSEMAETNSQREFAAIEAALFAGNKIKAIKLYRTASGEGLKESKDFIEAMDAELRRTSPTRFVSTPANSWGAVVLLILVGIAIAALVAWFGRQ